MARQFSRTLLALAIGLVVGLLAGHDGVHAAAKDGKGWFKRLAGKENASSESIRSDSSDKPRWKFWGRKDKVEEPTGGWRGWNPSSTNRYGANPGSKKAFETKVKKRRPTGVSVKPQDSLHGKMPKKKAASKARPTGARGEKADKRYDHQRFVRKGADLRPVEKKSRSGGPRAYWAPPKKEEPRETYSHKNGRFRRR